MTKQEVMGCNFIQYYLTLTIHLQISSVGIVNSFHYAFDRLNIERKEEASIKKTIGMPLKAAFTALTGLQDPRLQEQFRRYFVTSSNAIMTKNTVLFDDTIAVLRKLKQARLSNCHSIE